VTSVSNYYTKVHYCPDCPSDFVNELQNLILLKFYNTQENTETLALL